MPDQRAQPVCQRRGHGLSVRSQPCPEPVEGGNLTFDGAQSYLYDIENRMVSRSGTGSTAALRYDPLGRLYEVTGRADPL